MNFDVPINRPISLVSNIDKILKRVSCNYPYEFLESHNPIYYLQLRFPQRHSTYHVLIYLTYKMREQLDKRSFGCEIFVDLQKTFDTVDHSILV